VADILHFFSTYTTLGGVESILQLHAEQDHLNAIDSAILIACEEPPKKIKSETTTYPITRLGIRGWHRISHLRSRFKEAIQHYKPKIIVFHNTWACRHLVDLLDTARPVLMIHTDSSVSRRALGKCAAFSEKILCVSKPIADYARTLVGPEKIVTLQYPINPPSIPAPNHEVRNNLIIGYAGRLVSEQKKIERLIPLLKTLKESGLPFQFEVLGEGPSRTFLESRLKPICECHFHGRLTGDDYWQALRSWDSILFTSDYEGTPISLLEAMSQGVIPIYPIIQSGGDALIKKLEPSLLYRPEDWSSAIQSIKFLAELDLPTRTILRQKLIRAVVLYRPENYLHAFKEGLNLNLNPKPLLRAMPASELSCFPLNLLPFAIIRRMSPDAIY
jgi:glycosyltransferase involved in cell wall biosynthesis